MNLWYYMLIKSNLLIMRENNYLLTDTEDYW